LNRSGEAALATSRGGCNRCSFAMRSISRPEGTKLCRYAFRWSRTLGSVLVHTLPPAGKSVAKWIGMGGTLCPGRGGGGLCLGGGGGLRGNGGAMAVSSSFRKCLGRPPIRIDAYAALGSLLGVCWPRPPGAVSSRMRASRSYTGLRAENLPSCLRELLGLSDAELLDGGRDWQTATPSFSNAQCLPPSVVVPACGASSAHCLARPRLTCLPRTSGSSQALA